MPKVESTHYHFDSGAIYNGFLLIRDRETDSLWHHATSEAVYGKLKGAKLENNSIVHQITAGQTLERFPDAKVALSRNSSFLKKMTALLGDKLLDPHKGGMMMPGMRLIMEKPDARLPEMEIGLGVWIDDEAHFYPLKNLQSYERALLDTINEQRIVVYIDPITHTPTAIHANVQAFWWEKDVLCFNDGSKLANGVLTSANGETKPLQYPRQVFTRWYGFSFTFPECLIYL